MANRLRLINITANKIDSFLSKDITYDAKVDARGHLKGSVSISMTNKAPAAGLPLYVIGSATNTG